MERFRNEPSLGPMAGQKQRTGLGALCFGVGLVLLQVFSERTTTGGQKTNNHCPKSGISAGLQCSALQASRQVLPGRIIVIGDLHGDFAALRDVILDAGLVDVSAQCEWRGGEDAILVQLGDVVDRGPASQRVNECLRSLQASAPPGAVVRLTGNHELMWAEGDFRFASRTETESVRRQSVATWLEEVTNGRVSAAFAAGPILFTHAGLRPTMLAALQSVDGQAHVAASALAAFLNQQLLTAVRACRGRPPCTFAHPVFSAGPDRGGTGIGGSFWTDFSVLTSADCLPPGVVQIVGHSAARCSAAKSVACEPVRFRPDLAAICVDVGLSQAYAANRAYLSVRHGSLVARTKGPNGHWRDRDLTAEFCV